MPFVPLPPSFYERPTLELARALLGKTLVKMSEDGVCAGWIVETEGYIGPWDRAAHSYGWRRTARTKVMYGPPRFAYTYVMHTHCLLNVVSGATGNPEAVLIRAVEPCLGEELMAERRGRSTDKQRYLLTNGPGKLTQAMGIVREDYGRVLTEPPLYIAEGRPVTAIASGPRIGIANTGEAVDYPWRYWEQDNPFVSK